MLQLRWTRQSGPRLSVTKVSTVPERTSHAVHIPIDSNMRDALYASTEMLDTMHVRSARFDLLLEVEEGGVEPIEALDDLCENFDDLRSKIHDEFTNVDSETELDSDSDFELPSLEVISVCENQLTNCTHIRNQTEICMRGSRRTCAPSWACESIHLAAPCQISKIGTHLKCSSF
jgi:hypothetical protein